MLFAEPIWLWALLVVPLVVAADAWRAARDRARVARLVARPLWVRVVRRSAEGWGVARTTLLGVAVASLVLALARPQWGIVREKIEREGVDVVLVLDTSGSMATEDVPPSRFFLAKAALMNLVSRLAGDRFALVAFEGEAYPLVPLTLDADAIGLFLDTLEPGAIPSPGSSLGAGLAKGLTLFADADRRNKALVLVSDGEDLEGEVDDAVGRAKEAGVVVHTVGVGTEQGQPVPDVGRDGSRVGFKKAEDGSVVVSRLHLETLEAVARGTGGRSVVLTPTDTSLVAVAAAIEGMEQKTLAREFAYRKKERFQVPLGIGLAAGTLGLLLPPPRRRSSASAVRAAAILLALLGPRPAEADVVDEVLLRPRRATREGQAAYAEGNHPKALQAFERAARSRGQDPRARFNVADGLYKNGKLDEAAALYRSLGADASSPLASAARFNLGNALYQKQDYPGAVGAYRDALRLAPGDADTRRNLELALRALQQQQQQRQKQQSPDGRPQQQPPQQQKQGGAQDRPRGDQQEERERFERETGMPKERAMQLLDALQQNEKEEQQRLRAGEKRRVRRGKDW